MPDALASVATPTDIQKNFVQGMRVMFFLQLFSTIAFSMIFSLLVLYCLFRLHFSQKTAYSLVAAYNALGYALAILGGYLAERFFGYRFAIMISAVLGIIGMSLLTIPKIFALYSGLAFFSLSAAMMTTALFVLLGRVCSTTHLHRDSAFLVAYIGMDVGTFLAAASSGYISTYLNYAVAFGIGALTHLITLIIFLRHKKLFNQKPTYVVKHHSEKITYSRWWGGGIILFVLPLIILLLNYARVCNALVLCCGVGSALFIIFYALKEKSEYRGKLLVFLVLLCISTLFDALYFLTPSLLTVFTQYNVNRSIFGHVVPTATFLAFNPFFVITVGMGLSVLWVRLNQTSRQIFAPAKFAMGMVLMGCGFVILMVGVMRHDATGYVNAAWIITSYLLQTMGELLISPTGYAIVGCLSPLYLEGTMMGISQFSTGVAGAFSGFMANWISPPTGLTTPLQTDFIYQKMFGYIGVGTILVGLATFYFVPYLNRMGFKKHSREMP